MLFAFSVLVIGLIVYIMVVYLKTAIQIDTTIDCNRKVVPPLNLEGINFSEYNRPLARSLCMIALSTTSWATCPVDLQPTSVPEFQLISTIKMKNLYDNEYSENCVVYFSQRWDTLIFSFAGTTSFEKWLANADFRSSNPTFVQKYDPTILVHTTYWKMYESMREIVFSILQNTMTTQTRVISTGHSLGGSFAAIFFLDLITHNIATKRRVLYTFACPRTGNKRFAEVINSDDASFRVSNSEDVVPTIPLPVMFDNTNYTHFGVNIDFALNMNSISLNHKVAYGEYFNPGVQIASTSL
jgi:hypothetical protein